jgi:molybdopterin adenylyltransferase
VAFAARVLTISNSVSAGAATDRGGPALVERLRTAGYLVEDPTNIPDGRQSVADALVALAVGFQGVIVTTGGTGFSPTDETPEGTRAVIEREAPGLAEAMRLANPLGRLSRGVAGVIGGALVLNLPGSPTGAVECLEAVLDVVPHALELLAGHNPHPRQPNGEDPA